MVKFQVSDDHQVSRGKQEILGELEGGGVALEASVALEVDIVEEFDRHKSLQTQPQMCIGFLTSFSVPLLFVPLRPGVPRLQGVRLS